MLALGAICVAIGIVPTLLWPAVARAVSVWHPAWPSLEPPAPLARLGAFQVVLAGAGVAGWAWLARKARANGLKRVPTWDCGYAAPTARMQYTGGSFAGIVVGWFSWLLAPDRADRRPRGPFPEVARCVERVPDAVLVHGVEPSAARVMRVSTMLRGLQHGRLQFYILYVLAGLVALAAFVFLGSRG